jgi:Mg-chelatase subunit ChlD
MKQDLTDITLVVDRSGSMQAIRSDAEGGINAFISDQANEPGDCVLTLVQFDTEYEFVMNGLPIKKAGRYQLVPRGATALLDAMGRAINETADRIGKMPESDRPGLVVFVVMTDGLENSSREFTRQQIRKMIERKQDVENWQFTFLGANQDAFEEAAAMGMARNAAANYSADKVGAAWQGTLGKVSRMRGQSRRGEQVENLFTQEERDAMQ